MKYLLLALLFTVFTSLVVSNRLRKGDTVSSKSKSVGITFAGPDSIAATLATSGGSANSLNSKLYYSGKTTINQNNLPINNVAADV